MSTYGKRSKGLLAGVSVLAVAMTAGPGFSPAMAQDAASDGLVLEEILVTARRYEENLQDAPLAINVLTGDYLQNQRVESIRDIMELSPGATYVSFSKVQPELVMRGVVAPTPGNSSSEASIQIVVDGMVISKDFMKSPPIYDLDHVEVLRGPQGTTFGRNASIGAVHLVTKKPTQEFEAGMNVTAGTGELYEVDGYISGAVGNNLSVRLAFNFDTEDGPTESISTGEGLDGDSNMAVRASLLYEPSNAFSAYVKIEYSEDDDEAPVRHGTDCTIPYIIAAGDAALRASVPAPFGHPAYTNTIFDDCDPFKSEISPGIDFFLKREILTVTAELSLELADGVALTSITGYMDGKNDALADVLGTIENIVFQKVNNDGYMFSEELRVDNHGTGNKLRWLGGLYFLLDQEDRFEENRFFQSGGVNPTPGPPFRADSRLATISSNETNSVAIFGEVTYDFSERLELAVGGRWTEDKKDYLYSVRANGFSPILAGVTGCVFPPGTNCLAGGFDPVAVKDKWSDFTAKVSLQYELNDDHRLYALWSQGFKSGGFQPDARNPDSVQEAFVPETSNNYELGWKGTVNNRMRFSLAGFFLKVDDLQAVSLIPIGTGFLGLINNIGSLESLGLEGEMTWLVSENFRVGGNFAIIDSKLVDTAVITGTDAGGAPIFTDISGIRPDSAAKWTAVVYGEYDINFSGGSVLTLRGDYQGRSDVFDDITARDTGARLRPSLSIFGVRATWQSANENYRVMFWGKNLTEDIDVENFGPAQPNTIQIPAGFAGKRAFGVTASAKF